MMLAIILTWGGWCGVSDSGFQWDCCEEVLELLIPSLQDSDLAQQANKIAQPLITCIIANQPVSGNGRELPMDIFKFVQASSLVDYRNSSEFPSSSCLGLLSCWRRIILNWVAGRFNQQSVGIHDRILFYKMCVTRGCACISSLVQTLKKFMEISNKGCWNERAFGGFWRANQIGLIRIKSAQLLSNTNLELTDKALGILGEAFLVFNETDQGYIDLRA